MFPSQQKLPLLLTHPLEPSPSYHHSSPYHLIPSSHSHSHPSLTHSTVTPIPHTFTSPPSFSHLTLTPFAPPQSYCEKHSVSNKKLGGAEEAADSDEAEEETGGSPKRKKDWTSEQKNQARAAKLRQIEAEFYKHVNAKETANFLDIDQETTETIYNYWKLKRRATFNKPLLTPRSEEVDLFSHQQEHDIENMKMCVQLRQYLERVRNLCYMVNRRERLSRSFIKTREQTFSKQASLLGGGALSPPEAAAVLQANHGPSVYDRMYSHPAAPRHTHKQFERLAALMAGTLAVDKPRPPKRPPQRKDVNGLVRPKKERPSENPYKRNYVNGAEQRRSRSSSTATTTDSDSDLPATKWTLPAKGHAQYSVYTSSEEEMNKENFSLKVEPTTPKAIKLFPSPDHKDVTETPAAAWGRPGRRRRGSGRPNALKTKGFPQAGEDAAARDFDALLGTSPVKMEVEAPAPPRQDTSEDEAAKPPPPPQRRRKKKVTPPKVESSGSSGEDAPLPRC
ncbi:PHD finger protein rhinoceros [Chionoecetes opilio]|uniref:PHD finger protein rhinoceros n=1 Tax=Chionoecetes opilio TaxID=41210 RepID=A0A8J4Y886_CHIOP|nr:PHD finger protein rhinoceros [Chionoecetes opilio]